jgi:histidine ammonia-lyase
VSRPIPANELTSWLERLPSPNHELSTKAGARSAYDAKTAPIVIGLGGLTITDVVRAATNGVEVVLDPGARQRMLDSRAVIERALARDERIYGLTTGVGPQKTVTVSSADQEQFNRLMILAHCVGHGDPAPEAFVRATMLIRAEGLALGAAGVRPDVAEALLDAMNAGAIPSVRLIGSIGQADLSPLAEIARALIGEGPDRELLARAGLSPLQLAPKEALALISSNAFSVGVAALALARARTALRALELSAALSFEGLLANVSAIAPAVGALRPHAGIEQTIERLRELLDGSPLLTGARAPRNLQDPLCFRNVPQTHASTLHAFDHATKTIETELRSAADNPAVLVDEELVFSNGNHDITPVAVAIDYARLGLAQALTIANERIQKLLDPRFTGLPSGLRARTDLAEDGLAVVGHGSTALAAEARLLAAPATLEQPTSAAAEGIEDRVSLAPVAARRLHEMAGYALRLAAVELICAAQAIDLRGIAHELGSGTSSGYANIRAFIPFVGAGEAPPDDLQPLVSWLESG